MIVTVTANPAIDRLVPLGSSLQRGAVQRTGVAVDQPGGKGINVARVVHAAGARTCAVVPVGPHDALLSTLEPTGLPTRLVPVAHPTRVNLTLAEPDGTTTKLNAPGAGLTDGELDELAAAVLRAARGAHWVAICGSLPTDVDPSWYAGLLRSLRSSGVRVAVDTSGPALAAVLADPSCAPDVVKPNGHELVEILGGDAEAVEADPALAAEAAQRLRAERGPADVLLTLGSTGAVLATAGGSWFCASPPITPRSTVGAGDSALAGYLLARVAGHDDPTTVATAVAHGSAAAALPGSTPPTPADVAALATPAAEALGNAPTPKDPSWTA